MIIQKTIDQREAGRYAHTNFDSEKQRQEAERLVAEFVENYGQPVFMEIAGMAKGGYKIEMSLTENYKDGVIYTVLKSGKSRTDREITVTEKEDEDEKIEVDLGNYEDIDQANRVKDILQGDTFYNFNVIVAKQGPNVKITVVAHNTKNATEKDVREMVIYCLARQL